MDRPLPNARKLEVEFAKESAFELPFRHMKDPQHLDLEGLNLGTPTDLSLDTTFNDRPLSTAVHVRRPSRPRHGSRF